MQDVLIDAEDDLLVLNGDFAFGNSGNQNQKLLLLTAKGDWKQSPTVGCGMEDFLLDEDMDGLFKEIRQQYSNDGIKVRSVGLYDGKINIDVV